MTLLNRFCWARLLISSRRMLASNQRNNPLLEKQNHECIGRKSVAGVDSDGRGADWPWRTQLRYLLAATLPANGRLEEGHQHLYQFARWFGHCRTRGL